MSVRNLNLRIILGLSATQMIKQLVLRFLGCFLFPFKVILYGQLALLATNEKKQIQNYQKRPECHIRIVTRLSCLVAHVFSA
jgi:hypothetical protein